MREIKFRAYDIIGNKIVSGDLVHNQKVTKDGLEPRTMVGGYEVDPESVQQFTGLHDIHDKEIYEGDMLQIYFVGKPLFKAKVVWSELTAAFLIDEGDNCYSPIPIGSCEIIEENQYGKD